jgi:hypothetical protein
LVEIKYDRDGRPTAEYIEQMAVVDGDGIVQHVEASATRQVLEFTAQSNQLVQIYHPITGEPIPGQFTNMQQVMLGLLAFLRADQLRRDAA